MQRTDEMEKCESCCYFTLRVRSDHRLPYLFLLGGEGMHHWQLIPRDIGMKDSSEDLAGVRQPSCLSPPDVLLCLHPAGMSVEAADGHAFRPPWALFFFRGCHTSLGRPGPIIFCTEISAMS